MNEKQKTKNKYMGRAALRTCTDWSSKNVKLANYKKSYTMETDGDYRILTK